MPRRVLRTRDWLFGSESRRRLLTTLVRNQRRVWSRAALARAAGAHPKGGVTRDVKSLLALGVLEEVPGGVVIDRRSRLIRPLTRLIDALDELNGGDT